jgi:hypothetical protein
MGQRICLSLLRVAIVAFHPFPADVMRLIELNEFPSQPPDVKR